MQTKFTDINGLRIAYYDTAASGPAIILIHGNSSSKAAYRRQLASPLGRRHRLIALDLPGHGESDDASDPQAAYSLPGHAQVIARFAEQLDLPGAVYVGWSLGGNILLEASGRLPSPAGLLIFGTAPLAFPPDFAQAFLPNPAMGLFLQAELSDGQIAGMVAAMLRPGATDIPAQFGADIRRTDAQARGRLAASIGPGGYADEVQIVAGLATPLAILHGAEEQLASLAYLSGLSAPTLWNGEIQVIGQAGHAVQVERPGHFNGLLAGFASDVAR